MAERTIVTQVQNAVLYSDGTVRVDGLRFSYPHVFRPYKGDDDGEPKFSIVGLMPKGPSHRAAKDLLKKVGDDVLKENKLSWDKFPADRKFLRDGDMSGKGEAYEGHFTINASEKRRPAVRDADKSVLGESDSHKIYGGCYGSILIKPWFQNNKFGKRLNAGLHGVQFVKDGEPFGEGRISDEAVDATFEDHGSSNDGGGFDNDDDL